MAVHTLCRALRLINYKRIIFTHFNLHHIINNESTIICRATVGCLRPSERTFSDISDIDDPVLAKKQKLFIPRVTLVTENNDISVVTLEEAQKIAKRRNFKLVKVVDFDAKSEKPVYKLMKIQDFVAAESKYKAEFREARDKTIKEDKTISISSKITEHDLNTKVKSIHKMLGKRHGVRIVISTDGNKDKAVCILIFN